MELSFLLINQITVQFLMLAIGFLLTKTGILQEKEAMPISKVILYVVLPCSIINSFQIEFAPELRDKLLLSLVAAIIGNISSILFAYIVRKPLKLNDIETASVGYSNCGNLILPLVAATLGPDWVMFACIFMFVQSLLVFTHGQSLIRGVKHFNPRQIFLNIDIIACVVGAILMFLHVKLPSVIFTTFNGFGSALAPLSMLIIGMAIGHTNFKNIFTNKRIYLVCFLRLIAFPLLMILIIKITGVAYIFDSAKETLLIPMLAMSSCVAALVTQFSQVYNKDVVYASSINVMSVLFLIVTMPCIVMIYQLVI